MPTEVSCLQHIALKGGKKMIGLPRATAHKIAAGLSVIMSSFSIAGVLPLLARGAAGVAQSSDSPPYVILMIALITSVLGIVGAYGAWNHQRWGIILTILANLVNGLSAVPGIFFAPQPMLMVQATGTVIVSILIIVLCLWREPNPAAV
jgi:hypothetical protein